MKKTKKRRAASKSVPEITPVLISTIVRRLARNQRVRRSLPVKGRLHIDRQLPFLCVYRRPSDRDDAGTGLLVKGEASYLIAPDEPRFRRQVSQLVHDITQTLSAEFGAFLIVEIWAGSDRRQGRGTGTRGHRPAFSIHAPDSVALSPTIEVCKRRLKRVKILKQPSLVKVVSSDRICPPGMRPLLKTAEARELNCSFLGISIAPVYRQPGTTETFPLLIRLLRRNLSLALRQAYFEFARSCTTHQPPHYHALGRRAVVKAVWRVDRELAEISSRFDYLLQLTPVNTDGAWRQFRKDKCERPPEFRYRPLPVDPGLLKRALYRIPIERIEDPALQRLFREKQEELELKLTMLRDRDTPRFLYQSLQLFGGVKDGLLQLATDLLRQLSGKSRRNSGRTVGARTFARHAEREIEAYRQVCPEFGAKVQVTTEVNGLLVSHGKLLINADLKLSKSRIAALLAHEVGTHLLTYYSGRLQPFQQLYAGLAAYEELQEGLAVLAEFLVGGLSHRRMRQLAARVVAVRCLTEGASFTETFRMLTREHGFTRRAAYGITMRVFRGGGLTKDAVYLRGLETMLRYLRKGGDLNPLFVGKMAAKHIPIIEELLYRNVLTPVPIMPRYLLDPEVNRRLAWLREGKRSVVDLVG